MNRLALATLIVFALACSGSPTAAPTHPVVPVTPTPPPPLDAWGSLGNPVRFWTFPDGTKVFIGVDGSKVRNAADPNADVVVEADLAQEVEVLETVGDPVELIGRTNRWVHIRADAFEGYIFGSLLTPFAGEAVDEMHGAQKWALTFSPTHQPRLRVMRDNKVHVLDLNLTAHDVGGTFRADWSAYGDFDSSFDVIQCGVGGDGPDCVNGSARFIEDQLVQTTQVDAWRFKHEQKEVDPKACEQAQPLQINIEPSKALFALQLPSYMRGPSAEVECRRAGDVRNGRFVGKAVIDCSIETGGKSTPVAFASYRFIEQAPSVWRYVACDATESDADLMNRLADHGLKIVDDTDIRLAGPLRRPASLPPQPGGRLVLMRHETEPTRSVSTPLFEHAILGPVYERPDGDLFVPQPQGELRYHYKPSPLRFEPDQAPVDGPYDVATRGCYDDLLQGNTVLQGFDPGDAAPVAHIEDTPVFALPPGDPLYAAQTHDVMQLLSSSDRTEAEQALERLQHPFLVFQDPWKRWLRMVHSSLRTPNMCEPIIYLYADPPLKVSVRFGEALTVYRTWPPTKNGWNAVAQPDGRSVVDDRLWNHLFWDGTSLEFPRPDQGWVVQRAVLEASLQQLLPTLGLQGREVAEAIAAWKPTGKGAWVRIGVHPRARVDRIAPLSIDPNPDTSIRVFVELEAVDAFEDLPAPDPIQSDREGFVFVEWGLVVR